jgi:hypothetical protein
MTKKKWKVILKGELKYSIHDNFYEKIILCHMYQIQYLVLKIIQTLNS